MTLTNRRKIKAVYELATIVEQQDGITWYLAAESICHTLSDEYNVPVFVAAGVVAALSPRNRWERNVQDAESLIAAYLAGGVDQAAATKVCTFGKNKQKAIAILSLSCPSDTDVEAILSGPKMIEFYHCILGLDDVCIDGHAYCIWAGGRTSLADVPSIGVKLRREIKADYRRTAADLGLTPSALQAVTWVAWRRIHGVTK